MRFFNKRLALLGISVLLCLLVACGGEKMTCGGEGMTADTDPADTSAVTQTAATQALTDLATEADTALPTEEITQAVADVVTQVDGAQADTSPADTLSETEEATLALEETEAETLEEDTHVPVELTEVDFNDTAARLEKKGKTASDFIGRVNKAKASFVDHEGKKVLALTTDGVTANTADPFVQLKYSALAELLGDMNVDISENPYMVLSVKNVGLWSHTFALRSYKTANPSVNDGGMTGLQKAHLADTAEWQYISFDLSSATENAITYRLVFENAANANGETLLISSMQFFKTKEEAEALAGTNTYEIKEQAADNYHLKVMSFNVQTENGTSVRTDIRADMLRDLIDEYQPDSIGLQEVTPTWRSQMDSYVFNNSYTGVGVARTTNASLGLEQSCIFYRSDKFDLLDSGTFWLSDTPGVVGSSLEGANYPRICTYVHLKDKATGLEYIHMNTHLDHDGNNEAKVGRQIRLAQETVMLQKLATLPDVPTVITGDFNQRAHNSEGNAYAVYKLMTGERAFDMPDGTSITMNLADSRVHAPENMPEGFTASMTAYHDKANSKYNPAREPIDYVFYTPDHLQALSYAIRLYDRDGLYLSDHLPVITTFKLIPATNE